jgi:hypothetical protein
MVKYLRIFFSHILGRSYVTLQPIPSEFIYIGGKYSFLFFQCAVLDFLAKLLVVLTQIGKREWRSGMGKSQKG